MRQTIVTHNPFLYAKGKPDKVHKPEARFEIRARLRSQIEAVDADLSEAIRNFRMDRIKSLTELRNKLMDEMP